MLGLKLNHVSKRGQRKQMQFIYIHAHALAAYVTTGAPFIKVD